MTHRKLQAIAHQDDLFVAWVIRRTVNDFVRNADESAEAGGVSLASNGNAEVRRMSNLSLAEKTVPPTLIARASLRENNDPS